MTADITLGGSVIMGRKGDKEVIHSGHFMISDFEAEAQDDEENVLLEIPGDTYIEGGGCGRAGDPDPRQQHQGVITYAKKTNRARVETVAIDGSLTKLFNAMSIAYRHKITSPKWNRFKGLKLRWKDKIRLNNVIWRCWHMQFIRKKKMTVCQFALDVDIHNRPEAIVLEGKYWKRQLEAVTAEYKKWRIYYRNKICGSNTPDNDTSLFDLEGMDFSRSSGLPVSLEDGDLSEFMEFTDVLFSSLITPSQAFAFPNPREIARGIGNSDFIQPGLIQLQPNLDDFMDIVEPLQEMLAGRGLASVPEEDFLAEVGEAPELPPSPLTSAPGLQYSTTTITSTPQPFTPTPTTHNHTATTFLPSLSPSATSPVHKTLQQYQEVPQQQVVALPSQSPPVYQPGLHLHQSNTSPQQLHQANTQQPQLHQHPQQQPQPRSFIRSHSQQELGSQQSHSQAAFVIPKSLPRRRSHSSGGSSSGSNNSSSGVVVASPSLAPHQVISSLPIAPISVSSLPVASIPVSSLPVASIPVTSLPVTSLSISSLPITSLSVSSLPVSSLPLSPATGVATSLPHIAPAPAPICPVTSTSTFLAQLLSTGSYQVSSGFSGDVKVPLVLPAPYDTSGRTSSSSSCSSSSSSSSSNGSTSVKPIVTAALMAPITLSAVTPSTLKSQPFSQTIIPWSPCSPQGQIKQSPPHHEPSSPLMVNLPSPPNKSFRSKTDSDRVQYREHRRVCHINAEQKRRSNLKNNFDMMHQLIPSISQNSNAKISKAVMLQKGAEYIHQLKAERQHLAEKADQLKAQIETLCSDISNSQAQLPATGAPMTHARYSKLKEMFERYVRERTLSSWKFYIFSLITEPLLESFNSSVSTSCVDDLCRSSLAWLDQQCSLNVLRPLVSSSMRRLSTSTSVLNDPESLSEEVYRSVTKQEPDRYHPR